MAMTRKLQFSGQSGLVGYAIIRNLSDMFWDGAGVAEFAASNYASYKVAIPEIGSTGMYSADVPAALPVDRYHITYKHQAGAQPTQSDRVIFQTVTGWDGVSLVDDLVIGASIADVCNMALSHLAIGVEITNLSTDASAEAQALRRFYETSRDATLQAFPWPFAMRMAALPIVEADPSAEWDYSYRYPANALYLRRVLSGLRTDTHDSRVPYRIIGDDSGRLILTDKEEAEAEYVARIENPLRYTPDFVSALSYRLAANVAPRLTGGDPYKLGEKALQMYVYEIRHAQSMAANEDTRDLPPESALIRARTE
jgi:hypothetical protein